MIEFKEALNIVLNNTSVLPVEKIPIEKSAGAVLAEDVFCEIAIPPFNKSAVDGYAVNSRDITHIPAKLSCIGVIHAGQPVKHKINQGECVKIMTGAVVPKAADSIVMVENTRESGNYIEILELPEKGKNICFQGEDIKKGQKVLKTGTPIHVSDIALLATTGRRLIQVIRKPKTAYLNTGEEIVSPGSKLGQNKIYNCNGPQLSALLRWNGIPHHFLGIVKDDREKIARSLKKGFNYDILLISGGVSMGDYDFIPEVLKNLGVKEIFHKVKIKPGKPLFFAKHKKTLIFGIPGNPVSNFLVFMLFIQPALYKMTGYKNYKPRFKQGILKKDFFHKQGRKHFIPVKIGQRQNSHYLTPVNTHGSADIFSLSKSDGFMCVDAHVSTVKQGSKIPFITWKM